MSIAELLADGVPVHPAEAVAVVRRVCASANDRPPRVSHPTEIVLLADGGLLTGTGRERRLPATAVLAALLRALLAHAPLGHRAPPALCDVIAGHLAVLEPEEAQSARALADALQPFEGPDPLVDLRLLFARWRALCDLGRDLFEEIATPQVVVLDATESIGRSVVVPKPDRRRYERVAMSPANAPDAVLRIESLAPALRKRPLSPGAAEIRRAIACAHDALAWPQHRRGVRELALASALLMTVVPTGWWLAGSFPMRSPRSSEVPDALAAHAAVREMPETSIDPLFLVRPELISARVSEFAPSTSPEAAPVTSVAMPPPTAVVADFSPPNKRSTKAPVRGRRPMPSAFWFPDGKRIGYKRGSVLEIVDVKSGRTKAFSTPRRSRIGMVAVSPDGRRLVFNAGREGAWLLDLAKDDRQQMRRLITDPSVRSFVWSPDGKRLAYYSRRKGDWQVIQR